MLKVKIFVESAHGDPVGPAFDLAEVPTQLAALEYIQSLLTVVGAGAAWWGDPQQDALQSAIAAASVQAAPLARSVRILGVKPADVSVIGD